MQGEEGVGGPLDRGWVGGPVWTGWRAVTTSRVALAVRVADAGGQGPGRGQVVLDQLGLAHGLPGDDGASGQDQGEQHHDEQTSHVGPPRTILDRRD